MDSKWQQILHASDLDIGNTGHRHDLLDGIGPPNAPLDVTFRALCREEGVKGWVGVERVLRRMRTHPDLSGLRLPDEAVGQLCDREEEAAGGKVRGIAHHTSIRRGTYQSTWGTPAWLIEVVREALGGIDLDLASDAEAQKTVKAKRWYSPADPCPEDPPVAKGESVWCNPPGPCSGTLEFWAAWLSCLRRGARGAFLVFNLDHLRQIPEQVLPLSVLILRKRLRFIGAKQGANFPSAVVFSCDPPAGHGHRLRW